MELFEPSLIKYVNKSILFNGKQNILSLLLSNSVALTDNINPWPPSMPIDEIIDAITIHEFRNI